MILLSLLALLLLALVLWWLARPLWRVAAAGAGTERSDLEQLRDRLIAQLNELDAERVDRGVDPEIGRDEELRLSVELASVLKRLEGLPVSAGAPTTDAPRRKAWPVMTALLVLLGLGAGLYAGVNAGNLRGFVQAASRGLDTAHVPPMVFDMVAKLEKRLAEQPGDAEGWSRLGRSYLVLRQPARAREAYARAHALAPDNVAVLSDYAWLVFSENPAVTTGLAGELYARLARLDPENLDALWFLGLAAYQRGEVPAALRQWERLAKKLPPNSPELAELRRAMNAARASASGAKPAR
jgi:cytochrome c-type biogenesis protein CcmH